VALPTAWARQASAAPGAALLGLNEIGTLWQKPAAKGKKRCRLHGGAEGSGAPCGERNSSYRHGLYTREAIAERKAVARPSSRKLRMRTSIVERARRNLRFQTSRGGS
jgi:hypothetical protein